MQRSTAVNAHDLCGFLKLLLTGLDIIHVFVVVVVFVLVAAAGRSVCLPLLVLAAASSLAGALCAGSSATSLGFLLVAPLVLGLLQLDEPLDLLAALEVVALGAVDLALLSVGAVPLVCDRHSLAVGASGNLLAGATSLGFLGGAFIAGLLNNQHFLVLLLPVVPPPAFPCRGGILTVRFSCSSILSGEFPPLLSTRTLVGQGIQLADVLDLAHRHLLPHPAVTHVLMERADDRGGVDVWDVVVYTAESLDELAQRFSLLLDEQVKVARLAMGFVAAREGANKLMAQVCPRGYGVVRQVHEPGSDIGLEHQREVVGKDLVVSPPGSLHRNGVDAEELRRMRFAVVLLWHVWLEILCAGPLDLPQLTGERRAAHRVRQVAWLPWCMHVDRGPSAVV